ncbi:DNA polymerase IV [Parapedobacter sp. DT-150]|uniref:DNA polymerase IV n=1 Tax=Parapedobacter sp. DT-150 TaxID=3396162 RepID=UPI003F19BBB7
MKDCSERHIVHCDLDTFFVSVERLRNRELLGKPVLVGGSSGRGVVASCSYEARRYGVHSAMPVKQALRLCPHAVVVKGSHDLYSQYSNMVTEIIERCAPVVEKASIDEHYLDITGMDRFFGCWKWTRELRQRIMRETGLPVSFGLSTSKTVSKIATGEAKPCGERKIDAGLEKAFLAPLTVDKIPMVGDKAAARLRHLGITHIHMLQQLELDNLKKVLGENGVGIWKKANGIDSSPVVPFREQKSVSTETTFHEDTMDMDRLKRTLIGMVDELAFDLRRHQKLAGCVTLKIRYSDFDTHTMQTRMPYTHSERAIFARVMALFAKLYAGRMLIRLVGVKLSHLISGDLQIDLFHDTVEEINLMTAMDRIRMRYGTDAVKRGVM